MAARIVVGLFESEGIPRTLATVSRPQTYRHVVWGRPTRRSRWRSTWSNSTRRLRSKSLSGHGDLARAQRQAPAPNYSVGSANRVQ
jgi:hypothetical protein